MNLSTAIRAFGTIVEANKALAAGIVSLLVSAIGVSSALFISHIQSERQEMEKELHDANAIDSATILLEEAIIKFRWQKYRVTMAVLPAEGEPKSMKDALEEFVEAQMVFEELKTAKADVRASTANNPSSLRARLLLVFMAIDRIEIVWQTLGNSIEEYAAIDASISDDDRMIRRKKAYAEGALVEMAILNSQCAATYLADGYREIYRQAKGEQITAWPYMYLVESCVAMNESIPMIVDRWFAQRMENAKALDPDFSMDDYGYFNLFAYPPSSKKTLRSPQGLSQE